MLAVGSMVMGYAALFYGCGILAMFWRDDGEMARDAYPWPGPVANDAESALWGVQRLEDQPWADDVGNGEDVQDLYRELEAFPDVSSSVKLIEPCKLRSSCTLLVRVNTFYGGGLLKEAG